MRFEYLIIRSEDDEVFWRSDHDNALPEEARSSVHDFLNQMGADGWEVVSVFECVMAAEGKFKKLLGELDLLDTDRIIQEVFLKRQMGVG